MQRIRFRFSRDEELKFISHLDIMRTFRRAMRRAEMPLMYKGGFHPQPRLIIGVPLPLGVTSEGEYGEVFLSAFIEPANFPGRTNLMLPPGLRVREVAEIKGNEPSLMETINAAFYRVNFPAETSDLPAGAFRSGVEALLQTSELKVEKKSKKGLKTRDIRPFIFSMQVFEEESGSVTLEMLLQTGNQGGAHPLDVLSILEEETGSNLPQFKVHRVGLFLFEGGSCISLLPA